MANAHNFEGLFACIERGFDVEFSASERADILRDIAHDLRRSGHYDAAIRVWGMAAVWSDRAKEEVERALLCHRMALASRVLGIKGGHC